MTHLTRIMFKSTAVGLANELSIMQISHRID